ncbi:MAG TPA: methyltransferase domain-containing protein [Candidatus Polarisedimenticolaceae bacterium]|nr:methyltransferase domain-containing protein [Candidatus Polarisedimenticolaceae bacterium]
MDDASFRRLVDRTARRYVASGRFAMGMARGKLAGDPVYRALLERGIAESPSLSDLGCGRGLLLALVLEAADGRTPPALTGVEVGGSLARQAQAACGAAATISIQDLATAPPVPATVFAAIDVLHYLASVDQDRLLERIARVLPPRGRLFVREADGGAGAGFRAVQASERFFALLRGEGRRPFAYRSAEDWRRRLELLGLAVEVTPMGAGTPFRNVLLEARASA